MPEKVDWGAEVGRGFTWARGSNLITSCTVPHRNLSLFGTIFENMALANHVWKSSILGHLGVSWGRSWSILEEGCVCCQPSQQALDLLSPSLALLCLQPGQLEEGLEEPSTLLLCPIYRAQGKHSLGVWLYAQVGLITERWHGAKAERLRLLLVGTHISFIHFLSFFVH